MSNDAGTECEGGCLCGKVRYRIEGVPGPANYCHCADCRRASGSAFGVSARVPVAAFRITSGTPKGFASRAESGRAVTRYFCADCGTPLYTAPERRPDVVYVKAGSLDDPTLVHPVQQSWMIARVDWAEISPDLPRHERSPG